MNESAIVLDVRDLRVSFDTPQGVVGAVDGVSFQLAAGETLGLVGESGSGKSVSSLAVLGLVPSPPGRIETGTAHFEGRDLLTLPAHALRRIRGNRIAMIFQDPMTSLNPLLTVGRQLTEVLETHRGTPRREARRLAARGLGEVGLAAPEERLDSYPHELSGGMRQRVMIAMALLCDPAVLFADEPTTALDVTIQAQILDVLRDLQRTHGTAVVLITHDLGVVAGLADRVNVMYAGRLVETGSTRDVFHRPLHPYTVGLLASVPTLAGPATEPLSPIAGHPPDLARLPDGCAFAPRCGFVRPRCHAEQPAFAPALERVDDRERTLRRVACFETAQVVAERAARAGAAGGPPRPAGDPWAAGAPWSDPWEEEPREDGP